MEKGERNVNMSHLHLMGFFFHVFEQIQVRKETHFGFSDVAFVSRSVSASPGFSSVGDGAALPPEEV